jgi:GT2 family glycosyltransferase
MNIAVLVPTYNRVSDLKRCLEALAGQVRHPDKVVLVVRGEDSATLAETHNWKRQLPLNVVRVELIGQVCALNAGLAAADGDIIAITDDDAAPRPDWLLRIEEHFQADSSIGGVGGRDWVHHGSQVLDGEAKLVGKVQWFGRVVGNHHIGTGPLRDVDILKGANMSYRKRALDGVSFDKQLRGRGAQVSNDMALSLAVRRNGWRLVYDPAVAVDHYPAARFDLDERGKFHPQAVEDAAFNQYWALLNSMAPGLRRRIACDWQEMVGTRANPGLLYLIIGVTLKDKLAIQRWSASARGRKLAAQCKKSLANRKAEVP